MPCWKGNGPGRPSASSLGIGNNMGIRGAIRFTNGAPESFAPFEHGAPFL